MIRQILLEQKRTNRLLQGLLLFGVAVGVGAVLARAFLAFAYGELIQIQIQINEACYERPEPAFRALTSRPAIPIRLSSGTSASSTISRRGIRRACRRRSSHSPGGIATPQY